MTQFNSTLWNNKATTSKRYNHIFYTTKRSNSDKSLEGSLLAQSAKLPKIVGDIRHYPPANKEWRNSIYAYNKNTLKSLPALDKMANKTIKGYFSLSNNKKLARSKRMRNLIRRSTVKRLFVSRPEIKQTSDKVNITVYTFDREKQFLLRKMYFYNRNMRLDKDIYLYKLWLDKNLSAFKKTFNQTKSVIMLKNNKKNSIQNRLRTNRNKRNKTYIHNILLKRWASGINGEKKTLSIQSKPNLLHGTTSLALQARQLLLIKRNLFRSLKQRNLVRFLKKREMKKGFKRINIQTVFSGLNGGHSLSQAQNVKTLAFKNYFGKKVSRKILFKLRNKHNIFNIKQKMKKLNSSRFGKIRLPYSNLKFKNEIKFFSFKLVSELKYIRKLFYFYFIKYILSLLQIKIKISRASTRTSQNMPVRDRLANNSQLSYIFTVFEDIKDENNNKTIRLASKINKEKKNIKVINRYSYDKLRSIELLNLELLNFLRLTLAEGGANGQLTKTSEAKLPLVYSLAKNLANKEKIDSLYKIFERNYFLTFLSRFFKKEFLYINYYSKFLINQLKFGKLLPGLKLLMSKIYSKKVELNLVNLKYSHLNSDIYTESIATKLKKKVGLLRVLRWSLKLARLPYKYISNNNAANLNKLQTLSIYNSLDVNSELGSLEASPKKQNKSIISLARAGEKNFEFANSLTFGSSEDRLHVVLNKLYPNSLAHSFSKDSSFNNDAEGLNTNSNGPALAGPLAKSMSVLNTIRYKWVSGVRLEAAGRLTRRYTAARSVFKFRYKGSLKNIDYSLKTDITKKNISTVMLRNYVKPNSQYSFTKSKRRIGAFGLKAWISSY